MLNWLGVKPSYSRPRVSDDNAFAESLFRTAKYRPEFPAKGFETLEAAREWGAAFVHWYNLMHKHSGSLDIFWLKDDAPADSDNLPPPDMIAQEIVDDLEAALEQFRLIAGDLAGDVSEMTA